MREIIIKKDEKCQKCGTEIPEGYWCWASEYYIVCEDCYIMHKINKKKYGNY